MYRIFRENKQSLPGDEEIMKTQKPSIKIVLQPLITENHELSLPKLESSQLILQPNMVIESLKKYIKKKLEDKVDPHYEVSLSYKNIEMLDHYTIKDIERIYSFTGEKTIFYYSKKHNPSNLRDPRPENAQIHDLGENSKVNNIQTHDNVNSDHVMEGEENKNNLEKPNGNESSNNGITNANSVSNQNNAMNIDVNS